ncbi:unnamed protein product [Tilletia controversa]|nr:unnamed protein product [Tilletia controversa]
MASTSRSSALDVNAVPSLRAFYLGPRGTYSHSVARAVFDPDSASVSPRRRGTGAGGEVELVPCVTITSVLRAAFDAVSKPKAKAKPGEVNGAGVGVANGDGLVEDGSASSLPGSSIAGGSADVEGVRCAYAVLPIENSTFGPVHETLDALRHAGISLDPSARPAPTSNADADALIKGEYRLPVSHTLLAGRATKERLRQLARWGKAGAATGVRVGEQNGHRPEAGRETTIEEALAAEMALKDDYDYAVHHRGSTLTPTFHEGRAPSTDKPASSSRPLTSSSSSSIAPPTLVAAIGAELCAEVYGLAVLRRHIEDKRDNTTRFIVVQVRSSSRNSSPDGSPTFDFGSVLRPFEGVPIYST